MLDKAWVHLSRLDPDYERGAWKFVRTVTGDLGDSHLIVCPCKDCRNMDRHKGSDVVDHIIIRGIDEKYKLRKDWYHHGEAANYVAEGESKVKQRNEEIFGLYRAAERLDEDLAATGDFNEMAEGEDGEEDIPPRSPTTDSLNKCKLLDWSVDDSVVAAEGRCQCREPTALVNGLPLGPNAVKVFVDVVYEPDTFLWRPTSEKAYMGDSLKSFVAWPANKCVFKTRPSERGPDSASPSSLSPTQKSPPSFPKSQTMLQTEPPAIQSHRSISRRNSPPEVPKEGQKCKLMDIAGKKQVVAEG